MNDPRTLLIAGLMLILTGCGAGCGGAPQGPGMLGSSGAAGQGSGAAGQGSGAAGQVSSTIAMCRDVSSTPLRLDQVSALGFSGVDMVALAAANRAVPLEWQSPYHGGDTLEVDLQPTGGASLVDREPGIQGCADELRIDVQARVKTSDGMLDESFPTQLVAQTADIARFDHELDAAASAALWTRQSMAETAAVVIYGVVTRYGAGGGVWARTSPMLAAWPYTSNCDTGIPILNQEVRPSTDELLDAVRGPGSLQRPDGTSVLITLVPHPLEKGACYRANSFVERDNGLETAIGLELKPASGPSLNLAVRLAADLAPDGTLAPGGDLHSIVGPCSTPGRLSTAQFVQQCGDFGVDLTGFDAAHLSVDGYVSRTGSGSGSTIEIVGQHFNGCRIPAGEWRGLECGAGAQPRSEVVARLAFGRSDR